MQQTNKTTELRKSIAKSYCRDVLWIDDEFNPSASDGAGRELYDNCFHPIAEEFASHEILCHLKGFPQIAGEEDPYAADSNDIEICKRLALKADIVMLDWHLGSQNPQHSSKIIRELLNHGGNRFVVILSQAGSLQSEFETEFSDEFSRTNLDFYQNKSGVFALLLTKADFMKPRAGEDLIKKIFDQLANTYPDYLHWAAMEIAGRIKVFSPTWLASIPQNTDLGVIVESLHSSEDIGEAIVANLLEDLAEAVDFSKIRSAQQSSFGYDDWPNAEKFDSSLSGDIEKLNSADVERINSVIPRKGKIITPLNDKTKSCKKISEDARRFPSVTEFFRSVQALGEFCEVRSTPSGQNTIKRGSIIQLSSDNPSPDKILVCVSQSCDCRRAESLLFMMGVAKDQHSGRPGETFLQFKGKNYIFPPSAEHLMVLNVANTDRMPEDYAVVGRLRELAVSRIISRYWGQATRVGINQPRFIREFRDEKP